MAANDMSYKFSLSHAAFDNESSVGCSKSSWNRKVSSRESRTFEAWEA